MEAAQRNRYGVKEEQEQLQLREGEREVENGEARVVVLQSTQEQRVYAPRSFFLAWEVRKKERYLTASALFTLSFSI